MRKLLLLLLCVACNYIGFFFVFITLGHLPSGSLLVLVRGIMLASIFFVVGWSCHVSRRGARADELRVVQAAEAALIGLLLSIEVAVLLIGGA